jgi:hypothetical protein
MRQKVGVFLITISLQTALFISGAQADPVLLGKDMIACATLDDYKAAILETWKADINPNAPQSDNTYVSSITATWLTDNPNVTPTWWPSGVAVRAKWLASGKCSWLKKELLVTLEQTVSVFQDTIMLSELRPEQSSVTYWIIDPRILGLSILGQTNVDSLGLLLLAK